MKRRGHDSEPPRRGRVVSSHGRRVVVEDAETGERTACVPRGKRLRLVCADDVTWRPPERDGDGVVEAAEPRRTVLARPDRRGREEVLAANITQLVVVVTSQPQVDPFITDRYLAAARLAGCDAIVAHNKAELTDADDLTPLMQELDDIGYRVIATSAKTAMGLDALRDALTGHTSILVGQSGVGKSSLINALLPSLELATQAISSASGEGQHTTTAAHLYALPGGGDVIDSPGVRDYAPPPIAEADVAGGFVEIAALAAQCRFANCRHLREPDCAVRAAVEAGTVSARRYESYRRLMALMRRLAPRH